MHVPGTQDLPAVAKVTCPQPKKTNKDKLRQQPMGRSVSNSRHLRNRSSDQLYFGYISRVLHDYGGTLQFNSRLPSSPAILAIP